MVFEEWQGPGSGGPSVQGARLISGRGLMRQASWSGGEEATCELQGDLQRPLIPSPRSPAVTASELRVRPQWEARNMLRPPSGLHHWWGNRSRLIPTPPGQGDRAAAYHLPALSHTTPVTPIWLPECRLLLPTSQPLPGKLLHILQSPSQMMPCPFSTQQVPRTPPSSLWRTPGYQAGVVSHAHLHQVLPSEGWHQPPTIPASPPPAMRQAFRCAEPWMTPPPTRESHNCFSSRTYGPTSSIHNTGCLSSTGLLGGNALSRCLGEPAPCPCRQGKASWTEVSRVHF